MNRMVSTLFLRASGKMSHSKLTAIVGALINLLQVFGVIHLTPEQLVALNTLLVALFGIFLREGIANP